MMFHKQGKSSDLNGLLGKTAQKSTGEALVELLTIIMLSLITAVGARSIYLAFAPTGWPHPGYGVFAWAAIIIPWLRNRIVKG